MQIALSKSILRTFRTSDARSLAFYANNPNVAENLRDAFPHPYTIGDADNFIRTVSSNPKNIILAIEIHGEAVGAIGIYPQEDVYRKNAELGYWLGEPFWGQGIMTEAAYALVPLAFNHLSIHRIFSNVFEHNLASMKVLEKCGFTREAVHRKAIIKHGNILDELVFAKVIL